MVKQDNLGGPMAEQTSSVVRMTEKDRLALHVTKQIIVVPNIQLGTFQTAMHPLDPRFLNQGLHGTNSSTAVIFQLLAEAKTYFLYLS